MYNHRFNFLLIGLACLAFSCKHAPKKPLSGKDLQQPSDFVAFYGTVQLPFQYADTLLIKREKDSILISVESFKRFIPDSVIAKNFGKAARPKIYALGKTQAPDGGWFLFTKLALGEKRQVQVLHLDKKNQYTAGLIGLKLDDNRATSQYLSMDKRFAITSTVTIKNADGSISDGKDVYALSADGKSYNLVMTDALSEKVTELINPIDTLPRKNKISADYTNGKMNMVSVRDGLRNGQIRFFIHFEKNNGQCTGELKGDAVMRSPTVAEYREEGDPCVLKFIFSSNAVTLKEEEGCGSRRGLHCTFDGSFARKKYVKPADPKTPAKTTTSKK